MGIYIFQHPKTNEIKEIFQAINEDHSYCDEKGTQWNRVFTIPHAAIDTQINPFSEKDFSAKMGAKRGTIGDIMDASKEASAKREQSQGKDSVKQKYFDNWSKKRKGRKHPKSHEE